MRFYRITEYLKLLVIFSLTTVLVVGCLSSNGNRQSPEKALSQSSSERGFLNRTRSEWREVLEWPNDCEEAFMASYFAEGSGVEPIVAKDGSSVIAVLCAAGAYQSSFMYYALDSVADSDPALLEMPVYLSPDGRQLDYMRQTEVWGEPYFIPGLNQFTILNLSRQTRDCGIWTRYNLHDGQVEVDELWVQLPCLDTIQPSIDWESDSPPTGWKKVDDY